MAVVNVTVPTGIPIAFFIPEATFDETIGGMACTYVTGKQYTLRAGNIELSEKLIGWRDSGLISIIKSEVI